MNDALNKALSENAAHTDEVLESFLSFDPDCRAARLYQACRYSSLQGGKRIRPFIVKSFAAALGGSAPDEFAAAVELMHCGSLIHDDLPAMDDDDFRRGKPANHKKFGEATAILAGDALFIKCFELLAAAEIESEKRIRAISALAHYCGAEGMTGGQQIDIDGTGGLPNRETLAEQDLKKTGALLAASAVLGTIAAGGDEKQEKAAERFGYSVGMAFQMVDDLLDVRGDEKTTGKSSGKDAAAGKATYPSLYGVDGTERIAAEYTKEAKNALDAFGGDTAMLYALTDYLLSRDK